MRCNVRRLRTGWARVFDHRFQHLRSGNDLLARIIYLFDNHLLQHRHILKRNFHAHIAARDHNAVGYAQDLIDVFNAFLIFNLRNNIHAMTIEFVEDLPDLQNIRRCADKGCGDEIEAVLNAKNNISRVASL